MAKLHFRPYDPNQTILFPQRIDENIAANDPVRIVNAIVDNLNLDKFKKLYKETGRCPYHPKMMLKVILYAYMNNHSDRINNFCVPPQRVSPHFLFHDELRKLIIEQFKNLSKQMESVKTAPAEQPQTTLDTSQIEELILNIPQPDLSALEQSAANTNALIRNGFQQSKEQLRKIAEKIDNRQSAPLPPQKHLHTVELKSSRVVIALVSLGVALLGSMSYNVYQLSENSRLTDNDIKFRYIKAFGEITPENLLKLETIFKYEPDKQKQRSIRQMVEEHEQRVAQRARDLEQARLKEAQADQLRKEAERIKQKKIEYQSVEKMEIFSILHLFAFI